MGRVLPVACAAGRTCRLRSLHHAVGRPCGRLRARPPRFKMRRCSVAAKPRRSSQRTRGYAAARGSFRSRSANRAPAPQSANEDGGAGAYRSRRQLAEAARARYARPRYAKRAKLTPNATVHAGQTCGAKTRRGGRRETRLKATSHNGISSPMALGDALRVMRPFAFRAAAPLAEAARSQPPPSKPRLTRCLAPRSSIRCPANAIRRP